MNKQKYRDRINIIKNNIDLDDIKIELSKYRSIRERVNGKELVIKGYYIGNSNTSNIREIKEVLNRIIDDYSIFSEIYSRIGHSFNKFSQLLPSILSKN